MMRFALLSCVAALTVFFGWLVNQRRQQVALEYLAHRLQLHVEP